MCTKKSEVRKELVTCFGESEYNIKTSNCKYNLSTGYRIYDDWLNVLFCMSQFLFWVHEWDVFEFMVMLNWITGSSDSTYVFTNFMNLWTLWFMPLAVFSLYSKKQRIYNYHYSLKN